jgi:UDP-N-acetylmuramoylalanine--D-glutamate ligase
LIPVTTFAGKQVAIFGLGSSGLLSARALKEGGADVVVFDDDEKKLEEAKSAGLTAQDLRNLNWSNVSALVLAPGVPLTHPQPHWAAALARKARVEIIGDIELFCRERAKSGAACPLIAITGTNGKSTTTALTAHLLKSAGRDGENVRVFVECYLDHHVLRSAMVVGNKAARTLVGPFHRASKLACAMQDTDVFRIDRSFHAE